MEPTKFEESTGSANDLNCFCQLVLEDATLHAQLRETSNLESFVALAVRLGQENGCVFTPQEVQEALRQKRRAWLERWI